MTQSSPSPFQQNSITGLTRQEECLLKTALAMVLVKKRWQQEQTSVNSSGSTSRGTTISKRQEDKNDFPSQEATSTNDDLGGGPRKRIKTCSLLESTGLFTSKTPPSSAEENLKKEHHSSHGLGYEQEHGELQPPRLQIPHQLLQKHNRHHMDHLFSVACGLVTDSCGGSAPSCDSTTSAGSLEASWSGISCHLVQQLEVWSAKQREDIQEEGSSCCWSAGNKSSKSLSCGSSVSKKKQYTRNKQRGPSGRRILTPSQEQGGWNQVTVCGKDPKVLINHREHHQQEPPQQQHAEVNKLKEIQDWLMTSLVSHPQATQVHHTMVMHARNSATRLATRNRLELSRPGSLLLLDLWWEATAQLLSRLYHNVEIQNQVSSSDKLAVSLLDFFQALAKARQDHQESAAGRSCLVPPECLRDLLAPFCTPTNMLSMHWDMSQHTTTLLQSHPNFSPADSSTIKERRHCDTSSRGQHNCTPQQPQPHLARRQPQPGLDAGAKLLLRMGVYRIVMLQ